MHLLIFVFCLFTLTSSSQHLWMQEDDVLNHLAEVASPIICQCYKNVSSNFLCSNMTCQDYYPFQTQVNSAGCYPNRFNSSLITPVYSFYFSDRQKLCVLCNYSIPGCTTCDNKKLLTCSHCQYGYFLMYASPPLLMQICQKCEYSIPGCQGCVNQSQCLQCQRKYFLINGRCYQRDGVTLVQTSTLNNKDNSKNNNGNISQDNRNNVGFIAAICILSVVNVSLIGYILFPHGYKLYKNWKRKGKSELELSAQTS